jgi:antitoxin HigA-1
METKIPLGPAANTPGEILRTEFLEPLGLSQNELAIRTGLPRMRVSEIVRGRRKITAETAIAFGHAFEIEPQFWLNLQRDYDLAVETKKRQSLGSRLGKIVRTAPSISAVRTRAFAMARPKAGATGEVVSDSASGKRSGRRVAHLKAGVGTILHATRDRATGRYTVTKEGSETSPTVKGRSVSGQYREKRAQK